MATCKGCLHYEACSGYLPTDLDKDIWHFCREGRADEIPDIEDRCQSFKSKTTKNFDNITEAVKEVANAIINSKIKGVDIKGLVRQRSDDEIVFHIKIEKEPNMLLPKKET